MRTIARQRTAVNSFSPSDTPSRREATRDLPASLREASLERVRFRLRARWIDPTAPSGTREELIHISNPSSLLRLLRKIQTKPDRPLRSIRIEATVRPFWSTVPVDYVRWRSGQKERQDLARGGHNA